MLIVSYNHTSIAEQPDNYNPVSKCARIRLHILVYFPVRYQLEIIQRDQFDHYTFPPNNQP